MPSLPNLNEDLSVLLSIQRSSRTVTAANMSVLDVHRLMVLRKPASNLTEHLSERLVAFSRVSCEPLRGSIEALR